MDPVLDITMWLILCSVGFLAGFIDAIAGGGGMLTVPALLTAGLPPHIALGTNKLAASFGSLTASYTFYKKKLFNPIFWRYSLFSTAIGAIAGTLIVSYISTEFLEKILPIIIVITALYTMLAKSVKDCHQTLPPKSHSLRGKQIIQGLTLGFYDGVAGPGTGAFWTASSSVLYKINILMSSGLARSTNFVSNICSLFTFIYLGYVNPLIGISMGVFMMLGAWVGAHSAIKYGSRFIRPVFITVVLIMSINLAFSAWQ
jgi:uncharacterized membrane protein YfcA